MSRIGWLGYRRDAPMSGFVVNMVLLWVVTVLVSLVWIESRR